MTIGKFDGKHPCLTCGTVAGKVFLHNPHQHGVSNSQITYLNINKQITAVASGQLTQKQDRDVLLVGTPSSLQCYDVDQNKDLFFKDVSDGINTIIVGAFGSYDRPLAIVGGNCTVLVGPGKGPAPPHASTQPCSPAATAHCNISSLATSPLPSCE